jgi:hypothetical protein
MGLCLDHIEHLLAEDPQEFLGIDWDNAPNHSRGEGTSRCPRPR